MSDELKWTRLTAECEGCKRRFRVSLDALDDMLGQADVGELKGELIREAIEGAPGDALRWVAEGFQFCLKCAAGEDHPGEFDAPAASGEVTALNSTAVLAAELARAREGLRLAAATLARISQRVGELETADHAPVAFEELRGLQEEADKAAEEARRAL